MFGEQILVRSLSVPTVEDQFRNVWQYHSRSDRHSKIACWGVLFDTLRSCALLRQHVIDGKVVFGINHEMTDFVSGKRKNLDLVLCLPRSDARPDKPVEFVNLVETYGISLDSAERDAMVSFPRLVHGPVGDVLLALESKACMTAHTKAQPRFFDELSSAAQCINGSAPGAIAVGHAIVNTAAAFISSDRNKWQLHRREPTVNQEPQPASAAKALATVRKLTVRGHAADRGYDALGVTMLQMANDGSAVTLAPVPPALSLSDSLNYERMILRISGLYDTRFQNR